MHSPSATSPEARKRTNDRGSATTDPDDADHVEGPGEIPSTKEWSREKHANGNPASSAAPKTKSHDAKGRRQQKERRLNAKRIKAYAQMLDDDTAELTTKVSYSSQNAAPLVFSRIGASLWTPKEKERFFSALALYGRDHLPRISKSVATKSQLEVRLYLLELEKGLGRYPEGNRGHRQLPSRSGAPAAREISEDCESVFNKIADDLSIESEAHCAEAQRGVFGDAWLIDAEAAEAINALLEGGADGADSSGREQGRHQPTSQVVTSATGFLDVSMLLQLSRGLFMNGPPDGVWNYRTAELLPLSKDLRGREFDSTSSDGSEPSLLSEPAMYHSALNSLYDIAREIAQKLVNASLLQATSRLRAKVDIRIAPMVLADDVRAAADVLGFAANWTSYWAKLPRRAGLDVYSESEKYRKGRPGTKNGFKLTYDEIEAELGLAGGKSSVPYRSTKTEEAISDGSTNEQEDESAVSDVSSDGILEVRLEQARRKRKRELSPTSFQRAEEQYMRALDRKADRDEIIRLREMLDLGVPEVAEEDDEVVPKAPKMTRRLQAQIREDWRAEIEPIAAWETECVRRMEDERIDSDNEGGETLDRRSAVSSAEIESEAELGEGSVSRNDSVEDHSGSGKSTDR